MNKIRTITKIERAVNDSLINLNTSAAKTMGLQRIGRDISWIYSGLGFGRTGGIEIYFHNM